MQFLYHSDAKNGSLIINNELYRYIFKARRHNIKDNLYFRNLKDSYIYEYIIISLDKKSATLQLISKKKKDVLPLKDLHIGWCLINPKEIENVLPSLNEIGVSKITFILCQYSQNNIKINYDKLNKILINSSVQCGRSDIVKLDQIDNLELFIEKSPNTYMFNFSSNNIFDKKDDIQTIVIGCEGGFSTDELKLISKDNIVGCKINSILKSQTASITVASIILS